LAGRGTREADERPAPRVAVNATPETFKRPLRFPLPASRFRDKPFEPLHIDIAAADDDGGRRGERRQLAMQHGGRADSARSLDARAVRVPEPGDRAPELLLGDGNDFVERFAADVQRLLVDLTGETVGQCRDVVDL